MFVFPSFLFNFSLSLTIPRNVFMFVFPSFYFNLLEKCRINARFFGFAQGVARPRDFCFAQGVARSRDFNFNVYVIIWLGNPFFKHLN